MGVVDLPLLFCSDSGRDLCRSSPSISSLRGVRNCCLEVFASYLLKARGNVGTSGLRPIEVGVRFLFLMVPKAEIVTMSIHWRPPCFSVKGGTNLLVSMEGEAGFLQQCCLLLWWDRIELSGPNHNLRASPATTIITPGTKLQPEQPALTPGTSEVWVPQGSRAYWVPPRIFFMLYRLSLGHTFQLFLI